MAEKAISLELRAKLARRFEGREGFQARLALQEGPAPAAEAPPAPWDVIHDVLTRGEADGLSRRQLAGGIYAALVARGLLDGGRA